MKKSELRQLIKEEIKDIMNTKDDGASGYGEVMRKLTDKMTGGRIPDLTIKNTMRPKKIEIAFTDRDSYNNITVDGVVMKKKNGVFKIDVEEAEKYLEKITGMEKIDLQYINYFELKELLKKIEEKLAEKGIEFTSREDMNVD